MNNTKNHKTRNTNSTPMSFKWISAMILAAVLTFSGVGFMEWTAARAEAENHEPDVLAIIAMSSQEIEKVSEAEKTELRKMIMDFKNVDSMDLPYDTIRRLIVEADDLRYSKYRQILRESGCTDPEVIEIHAKWMYGVDNHRGGVAKKCQS